MTVSITLKPEVSEQMHLPRAAYVRFPYGYALGEPGNPDLQRQILGDALSLVEILDKPGEIVRLPYRWRGNV